MEYILSKLSIECSDSANFKSQATVGARQSRLADLVRYEDKANTHQVAFRKRV